MTEKNTVESEFGSKGNAYYAEAQKKIESIRALRDSIVSIEKGRTVENTIDPLAEIDVLLDAGLNEAELMESVHPDAGMRRAAELSHQNLARVAPDLALDRELYDAIDELDKSVTDPPVLLKRYMAHTIRDFRRAGVDRD